MGDLRSATRCTLLAPADLNRATRSRDNNHCDIGAVMFHCAPHGQRTVLGRDIVACYKPERSAAPATFLNDYGSIVNHCTSNY